jgi:hypothetical protein
MPSYALTNFITIPTLLSVNLFHRKPISFTLSLILKLSFVIYHALLQQFFSDIAGRMQ